MGFFSMAEKVTKLWEVRCPILLPERLSWELYFLFLVPRKSKRYDNFLYYLSDVLNFRVMIGSALAKILYIAFALTLIIIGLVAMVAANFLVGLIGTIILQIVLRALFEVVMVFFSIQENVVFLREKKEEDSKDLY